MLSNLFCFQNDTDENTLELGFYENESDSYFYEDGELTYITTIQYHEDDDNIVYSIDAIHSSVVESIIDDMKMLKVDGLTITTDNSIGDWTSIVTVNKHVLINVLLSLYSRINGGSNNHYVESFLLEMITAQQYPHVTPFPINLVPKGGFMGLIEYIFTPMNSEMSFTELKTYNSKTRYMFDLLSELKRANLLYYGEFVLLITYEPFVYFPTIDKLYSVEKILQMYKDRDSLANNISINHVLVKILNILITTQVNKDCILNFNNKILGRHIGDMFIAEAENIDVFMSKIIKNILEDVNNDELK